MKFTIWPLEITWNRTLYKDLICPLFELMTPELGNLIKDLNEILVVRVIVVLWSVSAEQQDTWHQYVCCLRPCVLIRTNLFWSAFVSIARHVVGNCTLEGCPQLFFVEDVSWFIMKNSSFLHYALWYYGQISYCRE